MKKVFLLAAVAIATSANAQVIQFNTDAAPLELNSDGKPLTAGTAIGSNDALSVAVAFDDTYKLTDCKGNAFNSIKFDDVEALTKGGITGSNNAVDVDGKAPRINHKVPAQGTAYAITSSKDGYMYIVNKFSPNKTYTIFEDGKLIGHKLAMETVAKLQIMVCTSGASKPAVRMFTLTRTLNSPRENASYISFLLPLNSSSSSNSLEST